MRDKSQISLSQGRQPVYHSPMTRRDDIENFMYYYTIVAVLFLTGLLCYLAITK